MDSTTRADLFDPATLASMGRIEVVARWVVDGFLTGLHRSPRKGFSVEFAEHRPYQPGDDLRYVDWRIAARADRWVVKQFEEETNLRALLVLDVSPSMVWRGAPSRLTKIAYAERLTAALALLLLRQRDAVGLVCFDERVREHPRAARAYDAMEPARGCPRAVARDDGATGPPVVSGRRTAARGTRRPPPGTGRARLRSAHGRRACRSRDTIASAPPATMSSRCTSWILRSVTSRSAATHSSSIPRVVDMVPAAVADVREAYRATVAEALAEWRAAFARSGGRYEIVMTDAPFGAPLRRAFAARQDMGH